MVLNLHPKCANPSCAAAFDWMAGGKLFRFRCVLPEPDRSDEGPNKVNGQHSKGHFWLCEHCSSIYTLRYERGQGIAIQPLWPELPAAENNMPLRAS